MGVTGRLARLAGAAEVPVLVVAGAGGRVAAQGAALLPGVRVVDSPRAANVLLVVGSPTRALLPSLLAIHDQLPTPRATVWWPLGSPTDELRSALPDVVVSSPGDGGGLRRVFTELLEGQRPSDPPALLDVEPATWRGVGPYGQGGTGMTGGVPYGRPLPGRAPDPDGLQLDQLPLRIGPLFPPFPPGLVLDLHVQGDVVREAAVGPNPFRAWPGDPPPGPLDTDLFVQALSHPVSVAELELARARHHLRGLARALQAHGLPAFGLRALALARSLTPTGQAHVEALSRRVTRTWGLAAATVGIGVVGADAAVADGPVPRAAGRRADARLADPAYEGLGFEPVVHHDGDGWSRLTQRLAEAAQALTLAERAGNRLRHPGPPLEGPRGVIAGGRAMPSSSLLALLPSLLRGMEWADAVTTVVSLDLDVEEAAVDWSQDDRLAEARS